MTQSSFVWPLSATVVSSVCQSVPGKFLARFIWMWYILPKIPLKKLTNRFYPAHAPLHCLQRVFRISSSSSTNKLNEMGSLCVLFCLVLVKFASQSLLLPDTNSKHCQRLHSSLMPPNKWNNFTYFHQNNRCCDPKCKPNWRRMIQFKLLLLFCVFFLSTVQPRKYRML